MRSPPPRAIESIKDAHMQLPISKLVDHRKSPEAVTAQRDHHTQRLARRWLDKVVVGQVSGPTDDVEWLLCFFAHAPFYHASDSQLREQSQPWL
jgi:hypothetical protein